MSTTKKKAKSKDVSYAPLLVVMGLIIIGGFIVLDGAMTYGDCAMWPEWLESFTLLWFLGAIGSITVLGYTIVAD